MAARKKTVAKTIEIIEVQQESIEMVLKGTTPFIQNRLPAKVARELLLPAPKKTAGFKATNLKHDPYEEFRDSVHRSNDEKSKTLIVHPAIAFKSALRNVAIDVPSSSSKAQLGRLIYVAEKTFPIWGLPELKCDIIKQSGPSRTPDVRSRVCLREWVAIVKFLYPVPIINQRLMVTLMSHAGWMQGTGDFRQEKGAGSHGCWELSTLDDPDVKRIMKIGRKQQAAALKDPPIFDEESVELLSWFDLEVKKRGFKKTKA